MKEIENHLANVRQLCADHKVDKMYLFGSVLSGDFTEKSDIDFLVRFKVFDLAEYFDNYMDFKKNLKDLLGREVDLVEEQTLKNPVLINSINKSKKLVYG